MRLTIDSGAVGGGVANPAQAVLDVHSTDAALLPKRLRIYAFGAALGGARVPLAAQVLAQTAGIPKRNLKLVNRELTYAHNDPNSGLSEERLLQAADRVPEQDQRGEGTREEEGREEVDARV